MDSTRRHADLEPVTHHRAVRVAADALRESAWFLRGEEVDVVSKRVGQLDDRSAELVQWAKDAWKDGQGLDREVILRGGETYHEICRYDLDTLSWLSLEPVLVKWAAALRGG